MDAVGHCIDSARNEEGKEAATSTVGEAKKEEWKFEDFRISSLAFQSETQYKKRSATTRLKYAEYQDEWYQRPKEGDWIGAINNVIQKELVMVGKVVKCTAKKSKPVATTATKSRKRKSSSDNRLRLADLEYEVQVIGFTPWGLFHDYKSDPRWQPKPGCTTVTLPFTASLCRVVPR